MTKETSQRSGHLMKTFKINCPYTQQQICRGGGTVIAEIQADNAIEAESLLEEYVKNGLFGSKRKNRILYYDIIEHKVEVEDMDRLILELDDIEIEEVI